MRTKHSSTVGITSRAQLRTLSSGTRQEIMDVLSSAGECSVARLGELMGRRPDSLYFHLRALEKAGLVVQQEALRGDDQGARFRAAGAKMALHYGGSNRAELARVVRLAVGLAQREFDRACKGNVPSGAARSRRLWGGRVMGWVDEDGLARINELVEEVHAVLRRGRPGQGAKRNERRAISFGFLIAPAGFGDRARDKGRKKSSREKSSREKSSRTQSGSKKSLLTKEKS